MRNAFAVEVNFKDVPLQPYEWESISFISGISITKVSSKCISDILSYNTYIKSNTKILLLSDAKSAIVVKLNDKGKVIKRSFLMYGRDEEICEYACNLKQVGIDYKITEKRVCYKSELSEVEEIKNYLIKFIKEIKDENKSKYLYYLYFNDINGYSKEKLIESIKNDKKDKCQELYDFLTQ